uniref:IMD domain-containing protein n=1 Tax=Panagrolaimus sp. JU765 TaxID=591449 RepID=A0AC34R5H8_9BILA
MAASEVEIPAYPVLFQSISSDLKSSQQTWDGIAKSANKMATQLLTTAGMLNNFIDQIQSAADFANNIKGASRDIGASLTRFCMRQRSIENHIRGLASALNNQFCDSMEKKSDEWKKRIVDIERRRGKCFKKSKKKQFSSAELIGEQREGCLELLFEQRNEFAFFVNALLPILDIEINLLGEGEQVKQVRDHLDQMVNETDPQSVVFSSMEDFCLNNERRMISPAQSIVSSANSGGLDRLMSPSIDSFYSISRNSTFSYGGSQRGAIPGSFVHSSPIHSRPMLPRQCTNDSTPRSAEDADCRSVANGFSVSAEAAGTAVARRNRPLSFSGDSIAFNSGTLKSMNTPGERSSASLIAETVEQIDRLGVELDSYCMSLNPGENSSGVGSSVVSSTEIQNVSPPTNLPLPPSNTMTFRPGYGPQPNKIKCRPPPPERRNSTIQTATTFAPSIADLRTMNGDYMAAPAREPPKYPPGQILRPPVYPGSSNQRR